MHFLLISNSAETHYRGRRHKSLQTLPRVHETKQWQPRNNICPRLLVRWSVGDELVAAYLHCSLALSAQWDSQITILYYKCFNDVLLRGSAAQRRRRLNFLARDFACHTQGPRKNGARLFLVVVDEVFFFALLAALSIHAQITIFSLQWMESSSVIWMKRRGIQIVIFLAIGPNTISELDSGWIIRTLAWFTIPVSIESSTLLM